MIYKMSKKVTGKDKIHDWSTLSYKLFIKFTKPWKNSSNLNFQCNFWKITLRFLIIYMWKCVSMFFSYFFIIFLLFEGNIILHAKNVLKIFPVVYFRQKKLHWFKMQYKTRKRMRHSLVFSLYSIGYLILANKT